MATNFAFMNSWIETPPMLSSLLESIESPADGVQIWVSHVEALSRAELGQLDALLDSSEHARAARFHFDRDRRRYVASRGFLRHLIASHSKAATRPFWLSRFCAIVGPMKISVIRILLLLQALSVCASAASNSVVNLSHYDLMRVDFAQMKKQGIVGVIHEASYPRSVRDSYYGTRQSAAARA